VPVGLKELFTAKHVVPEAYSRILKARFGKEWVDWEAETLWKEIRSEFGAEVSDEVREKLNALKTHLTTTLFWDSFDVFEKTILAYNDRHVEPGIIQVCVPQEIAYGMTVAAGVRHQKKFDIEVLMYIRACCDSDGLVVFPQAFHFAQPEYKDEHLAALAKNVWAVWKPELLGKLVVPPSKEDDPEFIQLAKIHDIEVYVAEKLEHGKALEV